MSRAARSTTCPWIHSRRLIFTLTRPRISPIFTKLIDFNKNTKRAKGNKLQKVNVSSPRENRSSSTRTFPLNSAVRNDIKIMLKSPHLIYPL